ncbi:histidine kinase/DNA gyrase B/HSP90-like ATPase [Chitinophaga skermanii]|uniref:histidine kinase n=1 Tax=Chitinophaga skermanii TaxID=331697 RepID=A0A327PZD6_9BACT|nr:ATP-binding protein [Chitinophaga skermanii]RAI96974.1 histidine kinase/DNA gyrase B/HSP90-like ATPase [Chitinophaga skermanii]
MDVKSAAHKTIPTSEALSLIGPAIHEIGLLVHLINITVHEFKEFLHNDSTENAILECVPALEHCASSMKNLHDRWREALNNEAAYHADISFINLCSIFQQVYITASPLFKKVGRLEYEVDKNLVPTIAGDSTYLIQILINLISNAVKHNSPGIHILISALYYNKHEYKITIVDDGEGFANFDGVFTTEMGHGLNNVKMMVTTLGGNIAVERKDDKTVFTITLPYTPFL